MDGPDGSTPPVLPRHLSGTHSIAEPCGRLVGRPPGAAPLVGGPGVRDDHHVPGAAELHYQEHDDPAWGDTHHERTKEQYNATNIGLYSPSSYFCENTGGILARKEHNCNVRTSEKHVLRVGWSIPHWYAYFPPFFPAFPLYISYI